MAQSSTPVTAAGALLRGAYLTPESPSQHVVVQLTVKLSDLAAALTGGERSQLSRPGANQRLLFAIGITDDAGALIAPGSAHPEATALSVVAPTTDTISKVLPTL